MSAAKPEKWSPAGSGYSSRQARVKFVLPPGRIDSGLTAIEGRTAVPSRSEIRIASAMRSPPGLVSVRTTVSVVPDGLTIARSCQSAPDTFRSVWTTRWSMTRVARTVIPSESRTVYVAATPRPGSGKDHVALTR